MTYVKPWCQLMVWAGLSVTLSMYNKWIMGVMAFNYPLSLSFMHMVGAAATLNIYLALIKRRQERQGAALLSTQVFSPPLAGAKLVIPAASHAGDCWMAEQLKDMPNTKDFRRQRWTSKHACNLAVVAAMFASSVCLRNSAFASAPLPLMQLLAACSPLGTYALSVCVGLVPLTWHQLVCLLACIVGVVIATNETSMSAWITPSLARYAAGVLLEISRVVMLQVLIRKIDAGGAPSTFALLQDRPPSLASTTKNSSGSVPVGKHACADPALASSAPASSPSLPTTLLAMYTPMCAAMLAAPAFAFEASPAMAEAVSRGPTFWFILAGNVAAALALNLASVSCLQGVGVVALSLTGFVKDWVLILVSTITFGHAITPRFAVGMLMTTAAVAGYTNLRRSGEQEKIQQNKETAAA